MKITLFTTNQTRHNYFINLLSNIATELNVIQESRERSIKTIHGHYPATEIMKGYFEKVLEAQKKLFGDSEFIKKKNTNLLSIKFGEINKCSLQSISKFLKSDIFIIFGSSYIKDELVDFLIKKSAINIHMGVSPYYRGSDCNFWALYDNNPHLVGSTIHLLSKGLDSGPILYHAMSNIKADPFEYTMSTVKSAFYSISERIKDKSIFEMKPAIQNKDNEIRYSKKIEFNEKVVKDYLNKEINLKSKKFDNSLLKDPYFLEK